jgi:hypothetical protein
MKTTPSLLAPIVLLLALPLAAGQPAPVDPERMADSIYLAEGGAKTKHPYGVLSVKVRSEAEARHVCLVSITNNLARWERAGRPEPFIQFMSRRWAPIGASNDPAALNKHWAANVARIYERNGR